ncbi:MAG: helix-turn-helix domain-containing protein [Bacteroidales bacterium]|nr:helix-turn-helix domain-containing protein [Bacteroidales bacterium]
MFASIIQVMEHDRPFRNAEFYTDDLAEAVGADSHTVAKALNYATHHSFDAWLARWRNTEIIRLVKENPGIDAAHLATQVGYASADDLCERFETLNGISLHTFVKKLTESEQSSQNAKMEKLGALLRTLVEERRVYLDPNLSIESLAAQLGTNRNTLSIVVHNTYGMTVKQLVTEKRITVAKQILMAEPEATNAEIASRCGFADASTFNRRFKAHTGTTPREWSKQPRQPEQ